MPNDLEKKSSQANCRKSSMSMPVRTCDTKKTYKRLMDPTTIGVHTYKYLVPKQTQKKRPIYLNIIMTKGA